MRSREVRLERRPDGTPVPDDFSFAEVAVPPPGPGEVLVKTVAAGVNRADLLQRRGYYPPPPGVSEIIGLEASGIVEAVGDGVTRWQPGDEVVGVAQGPDSEELVFITTDAQLLRFPASAVRPQGVAAGAVGLLHAVVQQAHQADEEQADDDQREGQRAPRTRGRRREFGRVVHAGVASDLRWLRKRRSAAVTKPPSAISAAPSQIQRTKGLMCTRSAQVPSPRGSPMAT